MDKTLLLVLFPFFTVVLLVGFVAYYARGGRPINLTLRGLGITFKLEGSEEDKPRRTPRARSPKL